MHVRGSLLHYKMGLKVYLTVDIISNGRSSIKREDFSSAILITHHTIKNLKKKIALSYTF